MFHSLCFRVPGALSLSAAMFASVCLASRLHTPWHTFATVTFSFQLFMVLAVILASIAATAFFVAAILVFSSEDSVANAAASFSLKAVALAMASLAAERSA